MSTHSLFDVHTHVQFAAFRDDADLVIQRSLDVDVGMINVGTQKDTSAKAVEFANKYTEGVYATVGLHPIHTEKSYHDPRELGVAFGGDTSENPADPVLIKEGEGGFYSRGEEFDHDYYKKLAEDSKVVAIGECGLDYYRLGLETKQKQKESFLKQIELASEFKKPLMIHCRQAFADLVDILQATTYKLQPSVVHFFSGTKDDAKKLMDLGFSFSFGGVVTFARDYDEVVKYVPLDRIMLETDAPYVAPVPYRGKRNEPAYVVEVAKKLAEIKNLSFDEICVTTKENTIRTFGL